MKLFDVKTKSIVLSASRMTDMPKYYPKQIIEEVEKRRANGVTIHTLVLWTKHAESLFVEPLHSYLHQLKGDGVQLYLQFTITGMGGLVIGHRSDGGKLIFEPNVPTWEDSIAFLPKLIDFLGKEQRIRLRIDPIIRIKDAQGKEYSNISLFSKIVEETSRFGIKSVSYSFLEKETHAKVDRRFRKIGCVIMPPTPEERERTKEYMHRLQEVYPVEISTCSVPGMAISKCIDGELLSYLHDQGISTDLVQPKKRLLCGCTQSVDIGGWPPKKCYSGCEYCYANAQFKTKP